MKICSLNRVTGDLTQNNLCNDRLVKCMYGIFTLPALQWIKATFLSSSFRNLSTSSQNGLISSNGGALWSSKGYVATEQNGKKVPPVNTGLENSTLEFQITLRTGTSQIFFVLGKAIPIKCFVSHHPTDPFFWKSKKEEKF